MAERLDKSGLSRLWRAIQLKLVEHLENKQDKLTSGYGISINSDTISYSGPKTFHGTCDNGPYNSNPKNRTVVVDGEFSLVDYSLLAINFTYGSYSDSNMKLSVGNNTSGFSSFLNIVSDKSTVSWKDGETVFFLYTGTNFIYLCGNGSSRSYSVDEVEEIDGITSTTLHDSQILVPGTYVCSDSVLADLIADKPQNPDTQLPETGCFVVKTEWLYIEGTSVHVKQTYSKIDASSNNEYIRFGTCTLVSGTKPSTSTFNPWSVVVSN